MFRHLAAFLTFFSIVLCTFPAHADVFGAKDIYFHDPKGREGGSFGVQDDGSMYLFMGGVFASEAIDLGKDTLYETSLFLEGNWMLRHPFHLGNDFTRIEVQMGVGMGAEMNIDIQVTPKDVVGTNLRVPSSDGAGSFYMQFIAVVVLGPMQIMFRNQRHKDAPRMILSIGPRF